MREELPLHLDKSPPCKLPAALWKSMTDQQKEGYLKYVREYLDKLEDEERDNRRKQNGY